MISLAGDLFQPGEGPSRGLPGLLIGLYDLMCQEAGQPPAVGGRGRAEVGAVSQGPGAGDALCQSVHPLPCHEGRSYFSREHLRCKFNVILAV